MKSILATWASALWLLATPAFAVDTYGAIAFSESTGAHGTSWNYDNRWQAEQRAILECGRPDCQVLVWGRNTCLSLAVGNNNGYGWAWNNDPHTAQQRAMWECSARTLKCHTVTTFCKQQ